MKKEGETKREGWKGNRKRPKTARDRIKEKNRENNQERDGRRRRVSRVEEQE